MNSQQYYDKYKRDLEARSFYKSKAWERCRTLSLERDNYLCQRCLRRGMITAADVVHHIKELKNHPELALDLENLESLCHPCHNKEHPEKGEKPKVEMKHKTTAKVIESQSNPDIL